ncbi:MAG TPA: alpha-1,4-glucan--maltose-1-phosphate maltosyltransferase [Burkholderiaceae bacterium]|nr:alpha-1,4-glucan--maltose-1-phosphate maltosyltransferase [Burkholderiaceae bacterium]
MSGQTAVEPVALRDGRVRAVIEQVEPCIDGGRFAIKRTLGDRVLVSADCFADGHDVVACELQYKRRDEPAWRATPMRALGNDRWAGEFAVDAIGAWQYAVCAWVDPFLTWRHDFERRVDTDDLRVAAHAGAELIEQAARRAHAGADARVLKAWARELREALQCAAAPDELKRIGLDPDRSAVAQRHPDRHHATASSPLPLTVERVRARFSSWYEFFPRSASDDPARHGTFADCEARLPYVQRLGFDVVYFPPIHPIGRERRKGRNNTLDAGPDDVGSPWAIGAAEGGHDAVLGDLGTLADFRRVLRKAGEHGIEVALDIALQCAPDHPWVREHPEWFRKRADGSIQYAENPPKKYQDIYPFDFESAHWRELWLALAGVIEFWVAQGVRIFRVDNPHTKAFPFWEWAITRVRAATPEVIFLSEAFTRPKVMHRLAKLGFSQSYTYYTWRNTKHELIEYFSELTRGPGREYFRPNAWPNTPDILPASLQQGGRAAFMARASLAATLAANWGIYGPAFELLEHRPARPGAEEYLHSEKYERRVWDLELADSLADFIAALNRARRDNPALQRDDGLRFVPVDNDQLIAYTKVSADHTNVVVCVVNLDTRNTQSGWVELDLPALGLEPQQAYQMHDLVSDAHFMWNGPRNFVILDPQRCPAQVMRLLTQRHRENDFDYFL